LRHRPAARSGVSRKRKNRLPPERTTGFQIDGGLVRRSPWPCRRGRRRLFRQGRRRHRHP
jgi:hypothetical protein